MNSILQKKSREMSYLLRHDPKDLKMDKNGYVLVSDILKKLNISLMTSPKENRLLRRASE